MKESDYEQLKRKDRLSRSAKKEYTKLDMQEQEPLQLSDEHRIPSSARNGDAKDEAKQSSPVLKTLFWLLRKLIAPIIMVVMLCVGLYIGYAVLADQPSDEVFKFETWKHLWDLIFADS